MQEGILKKHEFSSGDERSRKNSTVESDSDDNVPLKPKSSVSAPPIDKEREAIDIAREKNWEAVKRKHEEASKKEEAEAAIGIYVLRHLFYQIFLPIICLNEIPKKNLIIHNKHCIFVIFLHLIKLCAYSIFK